MNPHDMAGLNKLGGISHPIMKSFLGGTVTYVYIYTYVFQYLYRCFWHLISINIWHDVFFKFPTAF